MWPPELQYTRLSCPSLFPRVYSDSCPLCQWWHPTILCGPLLLPSLFSSIRVFSNESAVCISWPKYWSFSFIIIPSSEYSRFISFRIDWLDLLAVQGTLKESSEAPQCKSISSSLWSSSICLWSTTIWKHSKAPGIQLKRVGHDLTAEQQRQQQRGPQTS